MRRYLMVILSIPLLALFLCSCQKKNDSKGTPETTETLNAASAGGGGKSMLSPHSGLTDFIWSGPDGDGWYSRYYTSYGYTYPVL